MIRWYDWIVAFVAAHFFFNNAIVALFADVWYMNLIGALGAFFVIDLWNDTYIPFRKRQEANR